MFPVAQDLRVRGETARGVALVVHVVHEIDGVPTALEDECLGHRQAVAVRPGHRHAQFRRSGGQHVGALRGRPGREVRGRRFARAADEAALQEIQRLRDGILQPHRYVGCVLVQRILREVRTVDLAALQVDGQIEDVGLDMQRRGCGRLRCGIGSGGRPRRRGRGCGLQPRRSRRRRGLRRFSLRYRIGECPGSARGAGGGLRGGERRLLAVVMHPRFVVQIQDRRKGDPEHDANIRH